MDDSPYKINDMEFAIESLYHGAEIHTFSTANEGLGYLMVTALEEIKSAPEEWLVLTDMQMPIMDGTGIDKKAGRHVLNEMHRRMLIHEHVNIPAVVVSGDKQDEEWLKGLYEGCLGCIHYSPFVSLKHQMCSVLEPDEPDEN